MKSNITAKHIHESNLIEGFDDPEFDEQSLSAWEWLQEQPVLALSSGIIRKLQKRITLKQTDLQPDWRGYFRKIDIYIGGRKGIEPEKIDKAMRYWLSTYTFTHPHTSHVEFEKIHPFVDGNGRTGRMLMWWIQINRGEKPTLILNSKKQDYYKWFK